MIRMIPVLRPALAAVFLQLEPEAPRAAEPVGGAGKDAVHESNEAWHLGSTATTEAGEVLAVLHGLDTAVAEAAALAATSAGPAVGRFAAEAAAEHAKLEQRVLGLAAAVGASPEVIAREVARSASLPSPIRRLRGLRGAAFDSAYLEVVANELRATIRVLAEEQGEQGHDERVVELAAGVLKELRARSASLDALRRKLSAQRAAAAGPRAN